jgi:nucleolin
MPTRLLFSNLPFDSSDDLLRDWIEDRGYEVLSVKLIRDLVSGTSPSFAQVQLTGVTNLDEAVRALDGQTLQGRTLRVSRVLPKRAGTDRRGPAGMNLR